AFFNTTNNELVVAFAGTEGFSEPDFPDFVPDIVTDLVLAATGVSPQDAAAQVFIQQAQILAQATVGPLGSFDITYVGHSLGGFIAQTASASGQEGEVVVFNAPGAGGFLGLPQSHPFPEDNFTYVYSDPSEWGQLGGAVHSVGTPLSDNLSYVVGSEGHSLTADGVGLLDVLAGQPTLEEMNEGDFLPIDEALQLLSATQLLDVFDDGSPTISTNIDGTSASDSLTGTSGDDEISGLGGDDLIDGGEGNNTLLGGAGNDTLQGGSGADVFNGGSGEDWVSYEDATQAVRFDIRGSSSSNPGAAAGDTYISIENLIGSNFGDIMVGNNLVNQIHGGGGNDTLYGLGNEDGIYGGDGNDIMFGGTGGDNFDGGAGRDRIQYSQSTSGVQVDLQFGNFNNSEALNDTYVNVEDILGSSRNDNIRGDAGSNRLWGASGNDAIFGRAGNDTLLGGSGNDYLNGGGGNDVLRGDGGADSFHFAINSDSDRISDFQNNVDTIQLQGFGLSNASEAMGFASQVGADVVFNFGSGDVLTVDDATLAMLGNDILIFA
ncbi:MAG: hypothetical protein ABJO09_21620, partial [Hyphomicrobiales bacterium]